MELQIVLIGAVVFVISAVVIYLISAFTMKEKTFEEVIAEQKRQQEAENQKAKQEKQVKKVDKEGLKNRFKKRKEKVKGDGSPKVSESEGVKDTKMVEIELEPEIIEPAEEKPLKAKKKDKPVKSILHNKDEKTPVVKDDIVEEFIHRGPAPKDDLEMKHTHESKKEKLKKESKGKKEQEAKLAKQVVVEEMIMVKESVFQQSAAPPTFASRSVPSDKSDGDHSQLVSSVKSARLNDSEIQSLIEMLLNKQGGKSSAADWNKKSQKGDPVALLRKQLEEKERSLQEEQQMVMAANTKLKEIKQDLGQEKIKNQTLEKTYKEKTDYQAREVQALQSRIQHAHEQHLVETSQMRAMIQKLESQQGDKSTVQRLAEENKSLRDSIAKTQSETVSPAEVNNMKQTLQIIQKELSNNATKLNASENAKKTMEQKLAKAEAELKKYESQKKGDPTSNTDSLVQKRVDEVNQELRKSEAKNTNLGNDLKKAEQALDVAHKECVSLKTKLQELEKSLVVSDKSTQQIEQKLKEADRHKQDLDGNLKNIQKRLTDSEKEKTDLMAELQSMKQENSVLSQELQTTRERQQGEGQEAPKEAPKEAAPIVPASTQNGLVYEEETADASIISVVEHEAILAEKTMKVHELTAEIENNKIEIANLQKDIETQKKKNNELREKNWKAMDALEKSENSVSVKVQSAIKQSREELKTSQTETENFDKSVLQRLFPEVTVSNKTKVHKDWILEFEKQVSSHMASLKQQPTSPSETKSENRIHELEAKSADLEKQLKESETKLTSLKELEKKSSSLEQQLKDSQKSQGSLQELQTRLSKVETDLGAAEASRDSLQSKLQESDGSCTKLQSQISQYRNVLAETENKLTQLENSVETEEKKWIERIQSKDVELEQAQKELSSFKSGSPKPAGGDEDDTSLGFAYRCVEQSLSTIVDEMKERISDLESQLSQSEKKCSQLETQVKEAETKVTEYNVKIVELQTSTAGVGDLNKELEVINKDLQAEKKKNKELASKIVILNGQLKSGLAALAQEQKLVEDLKTQIGSGDGANSVPANSNSEINKLRAKLSEKEKQLEKETSANKLLTQRLAASQGSLNEAGTAL